MWKYCVLTPKRHYPAWIHVCWFIARQNRFNGLSCRSVERFCVQKRKKFSGNFGYMGRSNHWGDQMQLVWRYGGRNHVCNISWLSVKGCGCGERGVSLPSPIDLTRRPYNTGHTTVWPCDVLSKMVSVIFAVLEVSFWALTTVVKLPWKFLTLIDSRRLCSPIHWLH